MAATVILQSASIYIPIMKIPSGGVRLKKTDFSRAISIMLAVVISFGLALTALAGQSGTDEMVKKGDELYKASKYREAIEAYKHALEQDPNTDQAIAYTAFSYTRRGDSENARQWLKRRAEIPGQTPSKKA